MKIGWIKLHRQLQDNQFWYSEPFTRGQAWVDLLLDANHKEDIFYIRGNKIIVPTGFVGKSEETLSKKWKWSRGKTRRFIKELETVQQIVQHKSPVLSLIEVKNWKQYQLDDTASSTTDGTTERQQTVQQTDTNKNDKNEKNEKKESMAKKEKDFVGSTSEPIPTQIAEKFFSDEYYREEFIQKAIAQGMEETSIRSEIKKFCAYWTEKTLTGKKQRWQTEKAFEIRRRLATWLNRANKFYSSQFSK